MLFMTYKPKTAKNVKAERVTEKTIEEIAASFNGTAKFNREDDGGLVLKIATLDGVLTARPNNWVVRTDEGVEVWGDTEFRDKYEQARITTTRSA